jgi:hypothetical protein
VAFFLINVAGEGPMEDLLLLVLNLGVNITYIVLFLADLPVLRVLVPIRCEILAITEVEE